MKKCDNCCVGLESFEFEGSYEIYESDFLTCFRFENAIFYNFCPYCGFKIDKNIKKKRKKEE